MNRSFQLLQKTIIVAVMLIAGACSNPDDPSDKQVDLHVLTIEPDHGPKNTEVKIFGSGFGLVPADHDVTLNGKKCTVTDAFGEQLTITIPAGAGSGKIKIVLHDKEVFTTVFTYRYTEVNVITIAGGAIGFKDGKGIEAQFRTPVAVAVDTLGNTFVVDQGNQRIRKITADGVVTTFAGSTKGYEDGPSLTAKFNLPSGIARDALNNFYITDSYNDKVRKINAQGVVSTLAGSTTGYQDGGSASAKFDIPYGIGVDEDGTVFVADYLNSRIRKITPAGIVTTLAGKGSFQQVGGAFADGPGTAAYFYYPAGLTVGDNGTVLVADQFNHRIRSIDSQANVTTIGGSGPVGEFNNGYADGPAENSRFAYPTGICYNKRDSTIVIADSRNHRIRIIKDGEVQTVTGDYGYADGDHTEARFNEPTGVAIDGDGNILVADSQNHRIRKIVFE